jgi:hypothetical protein
VKPGAIGPLAEAILILTRGDIEFAVEKILGGGETFVVLDVNGLDGKLERLPLGAREGTGDEDDGVIGRTTDGEGDGGSHGGRESLS